MSCSSATIHCVRSALSCSSAAKGATTFFPGGTQVPLAPAPTAALSSRGVQLRGPVALHPLVRGWRTTGQQLVSYRRTGVTPPPVLQHSLCCFICRRHPHLGRQHRALHTPHAAWQAGWPSHQHSHNRARRRVPGLLRKTQSVGPYGPFLKGKSSPKPTVLPRLRTECSCGQGLLHVSGAHTAGLGSCSLFFRLY